MIVKDNGLKVPSRKRKSDLISIIIDRDEVFFDDTKVRAERLKKEIEEANKNKKKTVDVYPAITKYPPRFLDGDMLINSKLIRPGLIESVFPLAENRFMVSYFILKKDCIIACCCLNDIIDFVDNRVEKTYGQTV